MNNFTKLHFRLLGIILMVTNMSAGCTEVSHDPQFAVSVKIADSSATSSVFDYVEGFAAKSGLDYKTRAGNSEYLAKSGRFMRVYMKQSDDSYILIDNIIKPECISLSLYSGQRAEVAKEWLDGLLAGVREVTGNKIAVFEGSACKLEKQISPTDLSGS